MRKSELLLMGLTLIIWLTAFKKPHWGMLYFYFYMSSKYTRMIPSLNFMRIPFVTALITLVGFVFGSGKKAVTGPQLTLMCLLFLWMCFSRIANGLSVMGGEYMMEFFKYLFAMFLLVNIIDTREKLRFFFWTIVIVYGDLSFVARYYDTPSPGWNRNNFAISLIGPLAFAIHFAMEEKGLVRKAEAGCYLLLIALGLAGSQSRGAYLGALCAFVISVGANFKIKRLLFIIPILLYLGVNLSGVVVDRFQTIYEKDHSEGGTGGQRLALWQTAIRMMSANPVLGVGPGQAPANFTRYADASLQAQVGGHIGSEYIKVHQMFLQVGAETGYVGLGIFLLIIFLSFRDLWRARKLCKHQSGVPPNLSSLPTAVAAALAGSLVAGQFGNYGYHLQIYTFIFLATSLKNLVDSHVAAAERGETLPEEPLVNPKREVFYRTTAFAVFTYISLSF